MVFVVLQFDINFFSIQFPNVGRISCNHTIVWNVLYHHCACSNDNIVTNGDSTKYNGSCSYTNVVTNLRFLISYHAYGYILIYIASFAYFGSINECTISMNNNKPFPYFSAS